MIKLYRNIPSLHRFVELAPLASIRSLKHAGQRVLDRILNETA